MGSSYATTLDDSILSMLGISKSSANVSAQTAMGISTFFGCVRIISNLISSTPFGVYRELEGGGSKKVRKHSLNKIVSLRPNIHMSPLIAIRTMVMNLVTYGFSVSRIERDVNGKLVSVYPYPSSCVTLLEDTMTGLIFFQVIHLGKILYLSEDEVIFLKDLSFDGTKGVSLIKWQSKTIKLNLLTKDFIEKYYEKGTFIGGFIEAPFIDIHNKDLTGTYKKNVIESLQGSEGGFGMAILGSGGKWHPVTRTPLESQLMETFNKSDADFAKMFGIPLSLIGDTEKQTSWGTGVEQMFIILSRSVLIPLATQIEQEFNYKCFTEKEIENGYYTNFNFRALLRGDSAAYSAFVRTMVNIGAYSLDEVRALDELQPIEGGFGKRHYIQGAMTPLDKIDDIIDKKNTQKNGTRETVPSPVTE